MTASSRRRTAQPSARAIAPDVAAYKLVLKRVLDNRPSGMRHRLAKALGKNRSFISQMANPAYPTPAPARHLEIIFELCHFSKAERAEFLAAYLRAHPRRLHLVLPARRTRIITLIVPDLQDVGRNAIVDRMVADLARHIELLTLEGSAAPLAPHGVRIMEHDP
jgi:hypothetical protein